MELDTSHPEKYQTRSGCEVLGFYRYEDDRFLVVHEDLDGYPTSRWVFSDGSAAGMGRSPYDIIPKEKRLYRYIRKSGDYIAVDTWTESPPSKPYLTWIEGKPETVELIK